MDSPRKIDGCPKKVDVHGVPLVSDIGKHTQRRTTQDTFVKHALKLGLRLISAGLLGKLMKGNGHNQTNP